MLASPEEVTFARCRQELRRMVWRMQNHMRSQKSREIHSEYHIYSRSFCEDVDSELFVEQLISALPERGRDVIRRVVLDGVPEAEVAKELGIYQQAVNRWKRKMIAALKMNWSCKNL